MNANATHTPPPWPQTRKPPQGAPNVIVFLTDDVGFGACSTFGGPIPTPHLDRLAQQGLRFNQFHTAAMCSPTRASLLTGRNPHRVGMGFISNRATSFDGYTSIIPKSAGTLAHALRQAGYATGMFGKGHVTPDWEMTAAGPFDRWPTGLGFEYFYGFLGFDTNMWAPNLVENTTFLEPELEHKGKHFDEVMADRAIDWIAKQKAIAPDKPFFAYYATGTAHTPHHAPPEWLETFRGKFDGGWDALREATYARQLQEGIIPAGAQLTPRPEGLEAWQSLSADRKKVAARLMEAYAAALSHLDHHVGRVLDYLRNAGLFDDTLVLFIQGDNGGSAEGGFNGNMFEQNWTNGFEEDFEFMLANLDKVGGPQAYNHFPAAWGWALNTPFQYYKQVASHFGGSRNGLVMSWPNRIGDAGQWREHFHHVSDIMPTVLEAASVEAPQMLDGVKQDPLTGISMMYCVDRPEEPSKRKSQIFECLENCAMYQDGWMASTKPIVGDAWSDLTTRKSVPSSERQWELYHIDSDYSQACDLAKEQPMRLAALKYLFWKEAEGEKILPVHLPNVGAAGKPSLSTGRTKFAYLRPIRRVHQDAAPNTVGRSFVIEADVELHAGAAAGVIVCHGSSMSGYALFLLDGRPAFIYNAVAPHIYRIASDTALGAGRHRIRVDFHIDKPEARSGGELRITADDIVVAAGRISRTLRTFSNQDGFSVGCDSVSPVSPDYTIASSEFQGTLHSVEINLL